MPGRQVPDWRHTAKGPHYWVDEAADVERKLQALVVRAATIDPAEHDQLMAAVADGRRLIAAFEAIPAKVADELRLLQDWIASQTSGFLGRMMGGEFRAQFDEQFQIYGMLLEGVPESVNHYRSRLAELSPVTETGLIFCVAGHENHPSREACLVCGASLH